MSNTSIDIFIKEARSILGKKNVMTDAVRRLAWGTDAGFYRMIPKVIVKPVDDEQVAQILELASRLNVTITFRAAGTSLSGQAISDEVIMLVGKDWERYWFETPDASVVTFQPGITGARANQVLLPYGRKFSPDPASVASAMIGGIVANNASGMNCGTHANSYEVLESASLIFADGTILDSSDDLSRARFIRTHSHVVDAIKQLRDEIRSNKALVERIRNKYSIKNVVGLNLLPFIEIDDPIDIISHLLVGSEGTLAFISSVTVKTEKIMPLSASAMLYFESIYEACRAVQKLKPLPVVSAELLDKMSLLAVADPAGEKGHTALLIETRADSEEQLQENITKITDALAEFNLAKEVNFATDPAVNAEYWKLRSGVFPAVGATRPKGKTVLIEDVAFHLKDLPEATLDLLSLLKKHHYDDACIYGHVLEGNYHFIISQSFDTQDEIDRYRNLMDDVEKLVVEKYDGSLKAEHGTGRNMAPFVEMEWGTDAWQAMKRVKEIFDPKNILNRGVIFNDDKLCHIHNLKPLPEVNNIIDKCIECGFCEINCVSCGLGLSSRQRIVIAREITRLERTGENPKLLKELKKGFRLLGDILCAGDGLCSTSCPVKINTGDYIHYVREQHMPHNSVGYKTGKAAAKHLAGVSTLLRPLLSTAGGARRILGPDTTDKLGNALHHIGLPLWTASLPTANYFHSVTDNENSVLKAVYLPSCINRTMGGSIEKNGKKEEPLTHVMESLMKKAGFQVIYPENLSNLCCGMIWESKGMPDLADEKLEETRKALLKASENGKYPVVCDQSPCLHRLRMHIKDIKLYEPAEFIHDFLAPHLDFYPENRKVALHLTCSTRQMPGVPEKLINLAKMCTSEVLVPEEVGCCGFAGDKGFTRPSLNRYGLRHLRPQLLQYRIKEGFSNSRTCEIGLSTNGQIPYKSIAYLVDRVTKPKNKEI